MAANHGSSEDGALDMWMPPPKRFALQSSHGKLKTKPLVTDDPLSKLIRLNVNGIHYLM